MKGVCIVIFISLSLLALAEGIRIARPPPCPRACTREHIPRCAVWKRGGRTSVCTFPNKCTLDNQICRTGQNWEVRDEDRKCWRNSPDCEDLLKW